MIGPISIQARVDDLLVKNQIWTLVFIILLSLHVTEAPQLPSSAEQAPPAWLRKGKVQCPDQVSSRQKEAIVASIQG